MKTYVLNAEQRNVTGRKVKHLRKAGKLPGNIFGKKVKSQSVSVSLVDFKKTYGDAGETSIVHISIADKKLPVLISEVQYHPLTMVPLHVDFHQIDLKEKVTAHVPVALVGESPAVKDKVGVLLSLISDLEVEALPMDLPEKIEVSVEGLKAVNDTVKVENLKISEKVKLLNPQNQDIVKVAPLVSREAEKMAQEQAAAAAAAAAASTVGTGAAAATSTGSAASTQAPPPTATGEGKSQ